MASSRGVSIDEVVAYFQDLEDPRSSINRRHPLVAVVVIAVLGGLAGASGPTAIAEWAAFKEELLVATLGLSADAPGKEVFRRVLMALRPAAFQECFAGWHESLRAAAAETRVDQPAGPGRRRQDAPPQPRSQERPDARPGRLRREVQRDHGDPRAAAGRRRGGHHHDRRHGAQKAVAEEIIRGKADHVLALKGNQGTLHQAVVDHVDEQLAGDAAGSAELVTRERGHGREEERTYLQLPAPEDPPGKSQWKGLKSIGVVTSRRRREGKESVEVRYDIRSLSVDVKRFAHAARSHWSIENTCQWSLDVAYRRLNRLTLSLLKRMVR